MKRSTKIILSIVAALSGLVCVVCCLLIFQYVRGGMLNNEMEQLISEDKQVQLVPSTPEPTNQTAPRPKPEPEPQQPEETVPDWYLHVNFEALSRINEDIYAWVNIPGTPVSYAVVQSPTNDLFYNNHAVDKSYYSGGSIYSQRYNAKDFQDPVTMLYGHNRTTDTMFAPVNKFAGSEFFAEHPEIYVYTPDTVYRYEIFAAYPHSSEHLLLNHDFSNEEEFAAYFAGLSNTIDSNYRPELFPEAGERVITLSTCYKSNRMQRYLVQGVLTMEYAIVSDDQKE